MKSLTTLLLLLPSAFASAFAGDNELLVERQTVV